MLMGKYAQEGVTQELAKAFSGGVQRDNLLEIASVLINKVYCLVSGLFIFFLCLT